MVNVKEYTKRMDGALASLTHEFGGLRTGRASTNLLDSVVVEAYGSRMPISQVGTVNVPESRLLTVQVWDNSMVKAVEKAIANAGLGVNPSVDGQTIRVPLPALTEERRKELVKLAGKYAEHGRIAVRNVRRDGMDEIKKAEKDSKISEDEQRKLSDELQKMTDDYVKKIDSMLEQKEKDIMQV
ncbi:MAG: ribosome recycling factor [Alphaproteobacteria bacterium]|nr:MAG: ribosome recycling factor [Alphaproteobacteria bacterium]TAF13546.1 MAG: ribosome recycling factor [Alphaproteobacteria bacterium]TAF40382.1 MAG: ribosome recycling factor [Alphaproteobacteria bacterium]TAF77519.1 MAG: ribosome recycling factor [Alphaproteobacteria bacterium]